ncbi:TIGR02594 family protein [Tenacibaculum sp. 190524A02b]
MSASAKKSNNCMNSLLSVALSQYGVKEIKGQKDHPQILHYFKSLGFDSAKFKDETAWCSAFAGWVAQQAGYEYSNQLTARSWLQVGTTTHQPNQGDVVVLWRESPNSWKGHVGFLVKETNRYVYLLGGNQGNSVCVKAYPKNRVIGYRKLRKNG